MLINMTSSLLQGKQFYCREWVFSKIAKCLDMKCSAEGESRSNHGVIVMGGPGSGKSALCCEIVWPTSTHGKQLELNKCILAYYFCQAHDIETLSISSFIQCLSEQLINSSLIEGYSNFVSDPEIKSALDPVRCEVDPDEAFRCGILQPLSSISPPSETLFILVDSLDECYLQIFNEKSSSSVSRTIAELLANHHHLLPEWVMLLCTARKQSKSVTRLFTGFRKIGLDDLRKSHVVRDVQQYILCRLDRDEWLRQQLDRETAEMLNQLHIKSNGCFLYLEKALDSVIDDFILLQEICDIPGTLNGLYLWLCQRLFPKHWFDVVRPILNVMFAARRPLTEAELYGCVYTQNINLTFEEFKANLNLLAKVLIEGREGTKILFHQSFAEWLLDVKYCTQKYLCVPSEGHAMLAMSFTLHASTLTPVEVHHFALHLAKCGHLATLEPFHLPLWLILSGANIEDSLGSQVPKEPVAVDLLLKAGARLPEDEALVSSITGGLSTSAEIDEDISFTLSKEPPGEPEFLDSNGRTALSNAAFQGNLTQVSILLEMEVNVEAVDSTGQTPLCLAARHGHMDVVAALIKAGSACNHADNEGWTALRSAAWGGHIDVVRLLIDAGADINHADIDGRTALRAAAWGGHEDIVAALLEHGAEVDNFDKEGRTALIATSYMGHASIVRQLLKYGANVEHEDIDGRTALSVAALCIPASRTHVEVIGLLLEYSAKVDHADRDGMTPLLVAAYEGQPEICELLLENDADIDHSDHSGRTALDAAVSMGHAAVVKVLLFWGAYVDMIDSEGRTLLGNAAQQGSPEVVQQLLDRGLDEMHRDNNGWTPMHIAAFEGHKEVIDVLLEAGAHVMECDNDGRIPLLLAAQEGHIPVVATLLEAGSPVESKGHNFKTSFMVAALEGHIDLVHYLLCNNADINHRDVDSRTTLYMLALENAVDIAGVLLDYDASLEIVDKDRRTPLHVAAWQGHLEMCQLLLARGSDPNAMDKDRRTPIQFAAWQGHAVIVELLLEYGALIDHQCREGATVLGIAAQEGHEEVVRVLLKHRADPTVEDRYGRTAIKAALSGGHTNVVQLLQMNRNNIFHGQPGKISEIDGQCNRLKDGQCNRSTGLEPQCGRMARQEDQKTRSEKLMICDVARDLPSGFVIRSATTTTTSGVSSMDMKYSNSVANANGQTFTTSSSPSSTSGKRKSFASNNSSKSSTAAAPVSTNTISTNQSSSSGEGQQGVPITFTQELQQCSGPRSKNRSLTRILSPVKEPGSPGKQRPRKPVSQASLPCSPSVQTSRPSLRDESSSTGKKQLPEGAKKSIVANRSGAASSKEPVWQKRSKQSGQTSSEESGDASLPCPSRSTIVTNPSYSFAKNGKAHRGSDVVATKPDVELEPSDQAKLNRPNDLRLKKETHL